MDCFFYIYLQKPPQTKRITLYSCIQKFRIIFRVEAYKCKGTLYTSEKIDQIFTTLCAGGILNPFFATRKKNFTGQIYCAFLVKNVF